jgi:hypothetical protein
VRDWPGSTGLKSTSFGRWLTADSWDALGVFAYGIPTASGDVPITGSANYSGEVRGLTDGGADVWGSILLGFDFGAGTLSGKMEPLWSDGWDSHAFGTYSFTNTVYSTGSTTFSGSFIAPPGVEGDSAFEGRFNGPRGAEVMGSWNAPYQIGDTHGTMGGVFGASKGP